MSEFVAWNSQPLERWAERYAQGKFVELGGHRTHYLERGEGPPLILLHGFFYDSFLWAENIDALSRRFRVYALDLWGCGFSTREPLDYGYPLYAEQLRLFMDAMGVERAALVGQSMGAGATIKFCVAHRDRVDRLILVSAAGLPNPQPLMARFFNLPGVGEFFLNLRTDLFRTVGLKTSFIHDPKLITPDYFGHATRAHKIEGSIEAGLKILRSDFSARLPTRFGPWERWVCRRCWCGDAKTSRSRFASLGRCTRCCQVHVWTSWIAPPTSPISSGRKNSTVSRWSS
ncbi:MAG: alpha/beta fold hydrolase [Lysobacteraceae bacterium]|nr:MAG: alpha/beta fold hydrolase [Xanthomonadaceae bacterium]